MSDEFWIEQRAKFLAEKSTAADPAACGTCRGNVEAGQPVEHDECQQRATLLQAPDHPYYEILVGFSLEENEQLPARFHVPVFDDCGVPNSWLCAVCWEEDVVTGWPCATAVKYGTKVFTPQHEAETAAKKQAARFAELEAANRDAVRVSEELNRRLAEARTAAMHEAADWFDGLAEAEPDKGYRYRVMRGAAADIRRLAATPTADRAHEEVAR